MTCTRLPVTPSPEHWMAGVALDDAASADVLAPSPGATLRLTSVFGPLVSGPSGPWVQKLVPCTTYPVRHGPASTGARPSQISPRSGRLGGSGLRAGAAPAAVAGS